MDNTMKKLKRKFVLSSTFIMATVLLVILLLMNIIVFYNSQQTITNNLNRAAAAVETIGEFGLEDIKLDNALDFFRGERIPPPTNDSDAFSFIRSIFTGANHNNYIGNNVLLAFLDENNELERSFTQFLPNYTEEEKELILENIIASQNSEGNFQNFYFKTYESESGSIVAVMDITTELNLYRQLILTSVFILFLTVIIVVILSIILSNWVVHPAKVSLEKQKEFITNASHELKTPLTVIRSNIEVIEIEKGHSKWSGYIKDEVTAMSELLNDMLYLAKYDSENQITTNFDLSRSVTKAILPFESLAFEKEIDLDFDINPYINIQGDEIALKQLIGILIDNAIKNTPEQGKIFLNMEQEKNQITLKVSNTGKKIPKEVAERIFDRFYKADSSRNRENSGFGLGLAIANSIVKRHDGRISLESDDKRTTFTVVLKG